MQPDRGARLLVPDGWREFGTVCAWLWSTAASLALCPKAVVCPSGPWVLGSALCCLTGEVSRWGGRGEWILPSGGWRWNSQGLAGRAGDHQPMPSPKGTFGINLQKWKKAPSHTHSLVIPRLKHVGVA